MLHANGKGKHTREVTTALATTVLPDKGLTPLTVSDLLRCNHVQSIQAIIRDMRPEDRDAVIEILTDSDPWKRLGFTADDWGKIF